MLKITVRVKERGRHLLGSAAQTITFIVEVVERFFDNHCPQLAAALAYYAIFSIPPLLFLSVTVIGTFLDASSVSDVIRQSTSSVVTPKVGTQLISMLERANDFAKTGPWWSVSLSIFGVFFGATRGFLQLQMALNRAWSIRPGQQNLLRVFIFKRLLSFAMVAVTIGLLALLIIASASFAFFREQLEPIIPGFLVSTVSWGFGMVISLMLTAGVLAAIYKYLPDADIKWNQVFPGAIFAALSFLALQSVTTFYLSQLELSDTFGQAGSFALLLVWLYLCANVVFFGAQFAQVWCRRRGNPVRAHQEPAEDQQTFAELLTARLAEKFGGSVR